MTPHPLNKVAFKSALATKHQRTGLSSITKDNIKLYPQHPKLCCYHLLSLVIGPFVQRAGFSHKAPALQERISAKVRSQPFPSAGPHSALRMTSWPPGLCLRGVLRMSLCCLSPKSERCPRGRGSCLPESARWDSP
ncbi:hypothetical protein SKAU_G00415990 [Synaphobranchus kaupii]|uniref:Uncharacterized protein n=1 Tax=Synaphobranchus kaupii TaxID=118154 RepID=A0A9Q1E7G5_SYNKA|nr:hypothetical protein SKAU_G00415990 [Synaphobranchus kaupii]